MPRPAPLALLLPLLIPPLLVAAACNTAPPVRERPAPTMDAPLLHLVYVKLEDPADATALEADAERMLRTIPGVAGWFCGGPHRTGRTAVDEDYDVAMGMSFASAEDYRLYLEHPRHVAFVETWRPRCRWLRIHDVADAPVPTD